MQPKILEDCIKTSSQIGKLMSKENLEDGIGFQANGSV